MNFIYSEVILEIGNCQICNKNVLFRGMVCFIMKIDCVMLIFKNDFDVNNLQKVDYLNNVKFIQDLKK